MFEEFELEFSEEELSSEAVSFELSVVLLEALEEVFFLSLFLFDLQAAKLKTNIKHKTTANNFFIKNQPYFLNNNFLIFGFLKPYDKNDSTEEIKCLFSPREAKRFFLAVSSSITAAETTATRALTASLSPKT